MLITINDYSHHKVRKEGAMLEMKPLVVKLLEAVRLVTCKRVTFIVLVVGCSTGGHDRQEADVFTVQGGEVVPLSEAPSDIPEAQAAEAQGGGAGDTTVTPVAPGVATTPPDPTHVSLRFPGRTRIALGLASGDEIPYTHRTYPQEDGTVVTVLLPHGQDTMMMIASVDENGQPLEDFRLFTLRATGKLGTNEVTERNLGQIVKVTELNQNALQQGQNALTGPVNPQFIEGRNQSVMQGVFTAEEAGRYRVVFEGMESMYSFLDGLPVLRSEPFEVNLDREQVLALYPVIPEGCTSVSITLEKVE